MQDRPQSILQCFKNPAFYPHPVQELELIETHISWVFLTGDTVYKIKKPLNMGFLDFSTLEKRRFFCQEEIRINQRLAPEYYLDVVAVTATEQGFELNGAGQVVEYAVRMRQFPQQAQLDRMLAQGKLNTQHLLMLAEKIAKFHQSINIADSTRTFGNSEIVLQSVVDCYQTILEKSISEKQRQRVEILRKWTEATHNSLKEVFTQRKKQGFIRECHGDLHLRNIAIVEQQVIAFDGIEFNESLRWNDVVSEIAFLIMDLDDHQRSDLAYVFLNRYLQLTGDYSGLKILDFYRVYRAVVRAMVSAIRLQQQNLPPPERTIEENNFTDYLALAESYTQPIRPLLIMMYGLSGSGKTWLADKIGPLLSAIHIRSDIERKRLHHMAETSRGRSGMQQGIYASSSSDQTYHHLQQVSIELLDSGYNVIVDATFLEKQRQQTFLQAITALSFPLLIIHCYAPVDILKQRISRRLEENNDASDADLDVLEYQIEHQHLISDNNDIPVLDINTTEPVEIESLVKKIKDFSPIA